MCHIHPLLLPSFDSPPTLPPVVYLVVHQQDDAPHYSSSGPWVLSESEERISTADHLPTTATTTTTTTTTVPTTARGHVAEPSSSGSRDVRGLEETHIPTPIEEHGTDRPDDLAVVPVPHDLHQHAEQSVPNREIESYSLPQRDRNEEQAEVPWSSDVVEQHPTTVIHPQFEASSKATDHEVISGATDVIRHEVISKATDVIGHEVISGATDVIMHEVNSEATDVIAHEVISEATDVIRHEVISGATGVIAHEVISGATDVIEVGVLSFAIHQDDKSSALEHTAVPHASSSSREVSPPPLMMLPSTHPPAAEEDTDSLPIDNIEDAPIPTPFYRHHSTPSIAPINRSITVDDVEDFADALSEADLDVSIDGDDDDVLNLSMQPMNISQKLDDSADFHLSPMEASYDDAFNISM